MEHINSFFSKTLGTILKKGQEKETIVFCIKKITGVELSKKDIVFKNNILIIKLFGPKRVKIISFKTSLIQELKNNNIIVVDLK